jgi:hypothetical protein
MRSAFTVLFGSLALLMGVVVAESQTGANYSRNFGYCPEGTCGPRGGTKTIDVTRCSPKYCKPRVRAKGEKPDWR